MFEVDLHELDPIGAFKSEEWARRIYGFYEIVDSFEVVAGYELPHTWEGEVKINI